MSVEKSNVEYAENATEQSKSPSLGPVEEGEFSSKLTLRTVLCVLSINTMYFAQLINLVGGGALGWTIVNYFGGTGSQVWILGPVIIATVTLGPIFSQASDFWGRKRILIGATLCGGFGNLIVARATSFGMVIAGQTIVGISAGASPLLLAVPAEILPRKYRGWAQASNIIANSLGVSTAALATGALDVNASPASDGFRGYYYMAVGVFFLSPILLFLFYKPTEFLKQQLSLREKLQTLDWVAYFLMCSSLTLFCISLSWFQYPFSFGDPHVAAPFAVSVVLFIILVIHQTRYKTDGMFHHGLFSGERNFAIVLFSVFADGAAFIACTIYYTWQIQIFYQPNAFRASVPYVLMWLVAGLGAAGAGLYGAVYKGSRWITVFGFASFLAYFICMATTTTTSYPPIWGYAVFLGIGMGVTLVSLITLAQISTPPDLIALASGLLISTRALGGMESNVAAAVLPLGFPNASLAQLLAAFNDPSSTPFSSIIDLTPEIIEKGQAAVASTCLRTFHRIWILGAAIVAVAIIAALFIQDKQHEFNQHIDAPLRAKHVRSSEGKFV